MKEESRNPSFFRPPLLRQEWADEGEIRHELPHVNWGDLFFDLFYVGVAYNLANIIKNDPSFMGLLYFFGCFGPVFSNFWLYKMLYDARYETPDDVVHRVFEILQLCILAMATQHIRPVEVMAHGGPNNPEMFLFCLANLLGSVIALVSRLEIGFHWVGAGSERGVNAAKVASRTDAIHMLLSTIITAVATVYAALVYFDVSSSGGDQDNVAIWILLAGWLMRTIIMRYVYKLRGLGGENHKKISVPMNLEFVIHRYGEWTMLMLGESILSLVIVDDISDAKDGEYYLTFYFGLVSVILLQFVYFKSSPQHAEDHAMRRSSNAAFLYNFLIQFYSASLIIVGVSYKMLLTEYTSKYAYEYEDDYKRGLGADDGSKKLSTDERRQRIAWFFCCGLIGTFLFLDMMNLTHTGLKASYEKCHCPTGKTLRVKGLLFCVFSRICISVCVIILSLQIYYDPKYIALLGLVSVVLQVWIRFLGTIYFPSATVSINDHHHDHHKDADIFHENKKTDVP